MTVGRVGRFQELMKREGIDASMIKTESSFTYFAGVKWLRPGLIIPLEGEPVAYIPTHEVKAFVEASGIEEVVPYRGVDELMRGVSSTIRERGYKKVGFDMSVERDAYELFFHMFKNLNPKTEIVDVHSMIMQLRMIKDPTEIESIRQAASTTDKGMEAAFSRIDVGVSELEIAAEATYAMMKAGSEHPHAYVNAGPLPRIHAEPRSDVRVKSDDVVTITLAGDSGHYYSNETRTHVMHAAAKEKFKALEAMEGIYNTVRQKLRPGVPLNSVEDWIGEVLRAQGYAENYVKGFAHGVGLLVEEDPITTILIPERRTVVKENMVLAALHAPLAIPDVGAIKCEDTFLVTSNGTEQLTRFGDRVV
jgi:Xaa-Pro dipeptidase